MIVRKRPEVDLKLKYRKVLELSLIGALVLGIVGLHLLRFISLRAEEREAPEIKIQVTDIPPTEQLKRPPPPARPTVPVPTENEDIPDDVTIETTELNIFEELPPPPPPPTTDEETASIFVAYDEAPYPIGGLPAIQKKLKYPEIARKAGVEGRVIIHVLVSEKGDVVDTKVLKSIGTAGCDDAAITAIRSVKWKPAMQRDKPVKVWVAIPVVFRLK